MSKLSRRRLLKFAAAGAACTIAAPYFIPRGVLAADGKPGANERVAVGAIGVRRSGNPLAPATARNGVKWSQSHA